MVTGVKKSNFSGSQTVPGAATFDYVYNGFNTKITLDNLAVALGTSGTVRQVGASADYPVLDMQGLTSGIRNLKEGPGISIQISPQNSLEISTATTFDNTGVTLVDDPAQSILNYRSIIAGSNMLITSPLDGQINIAFNDSDITPANQVVVNELSDFPAPSAGRITLEDGKNYILGAPINVGTNEIHFGNGSRLTANNLLANPLTYTGTGTAINCIDVNAVIENMQLAAPNGTGYNYSSSTGATAVIQRFFLILTCQKIGNITNIGTFDSTDSTTFNAPDGISVFGNLGGIFSITKTQISGLTSGNSGIDFGTSVHNTLELRDLSLNGATGSTGIKGAAASANMFPNRLGNITGCDFNSTITPTSGITPDSIRFNFNGNSRLKDTFPDAMISLSGNATPTVISAGVPTLVLGTWVEERASQWTSTAAGRSTWAGEIPLTSPITISADVVPVAGTNKDITLCVAINGVVRPSGGRTVRADNTHPLAVTIVWQEIINPGDYVELWVTSADGTDVIVNAVNRIR